MLTSLLDPADEIVGLDYLTTQYHLKLDYKNSLAQAQDSEEIFKAQAVVKKSLCEKQMSTTMLEH